MQDTGCLRAYHPAPEIGVARMVVQLKACPVVFRARGKRWEVMAFRHPLAGYQFVKGSVEPGESLVQAAVRELFEESGVSPAVPMISAGEFQLGEERRPWRFFHVEMAGLPASWSHRTTDDGGHVFEFFWHPVDLPLDAGWHELFHEVFDIIRGIAARLQPP